MNAPILAFDQGTTSSRAIVFAAGAGGALSPVAVAQRETTQHFPQPGWIEHDADEIWTTSLACAREALEKAGVQAADLAAIGITNQRETVVVWDRATGRPIHRAIVWQDRRTARDLDAMRAKGVADEVAALTGLRLDPYFSASKVAWILDHVEGARARAERGELACGTIDAWLLWNLTAGAVHATDASNASRTMLARLVDGEGCAWSERLCALFAVPQGMLPRIVDSAGAIARTARAVLGAEVPVTGIAGDQQAALYGQRCMAAGDAKCTFGTGCFLLANAGARRPEAPAGLLSTVAWRIGGRTDFAVEGSVFVGGSAVQWLRDGLCVITSARQVNDLAGSVPDSAGVFVVPAFTGLGAPWWDADARGAILGLTRGSTRAHIARATLEGIAHQVADLVEAIEAGGIRVARLRVDGGAAASDLLMQLQADLAGRAVERPVVLETTALGAAMLAARGLAAGEAGAAGAIDRTFAPSIDDAARTARRARWRQAVATVRAFGSHG
ncbi:MAG: glycerol kinase GlpK [Planctomycetota bacterium]